MPGVDTSNCTSVAGVCSNDNFTLITGWPCLSTKRCQTCVMAKKWTTKYAWPCKYAYPEDCQDHFWASQSDMTCNEFFPDFDFIPRGGTQSPAFDWATAGQVSCDKDASSKAAVSSLSNQLLAPEFTALITNQSVEPCKLAYGSCEYANKNFIGAAECHKW
ncbi:hypothetical protein PRIPAC_71884 [Pristionchus pacificus]|uniref:Uncharacterized protein n=1 Tax=Pristionchus pacificus TaxID=54126 RepID=A0A2A6C826_PRIPA|nr:hypothetical protein PRIPAC_71884 [Pristionchus pacificus]|eukprot:PDM74228.1 hypothetical protein PRIPAC_41584 [Pristionchus pacificus]